MNSILDELKWRDILKQVTNEDKVVKAQRSGAALYCGFDPTADSLHVGHLIQIMNLKRFQDFGFHPLAIIGGGTGMIGDPSFKAAERKLLTIETVDEYVSGIKAQLNRLIPDITVVNNADWLRKMSLIDFLRFVGKDFNLAYLLAKDNIASRIEKGLSITEFAYTMLQAYDFYELYENYNCRVQIGGSDQWGNITSGTDYISSRIGHAESDACGVTMNLLTKKDGTKFGKTESGAVWLDAAKTSEYEFYQFFINQDDADCEKFLKYLTFLSESEIKAIISEHQTAPHKRIMQNRLADEVTLFVHGRDGLERAKKITASFFNGTLSDLSEAELRSTFNSIPLAESTFGLGIVDFLVKNQIASSNREAREFIQSGAIAINDQKITTEDVIVAKDMAIFKDILIVKRGKKKYFAVIAK
jgi:tyrosyl-tRNA synthetase